jgi:hypothetical protein
MADGDGAACIEVAVNLIGGKFLPNSINVRENHYLMNVFPAGAY